MLKKVDNVLTIEQTISKKYVDSDGTLNSAEAEFAEQIKANDLQLRKEIAIWKENEYLPKIIF